MTDVRDIYQVSTPSDAPPWAQQLVSSLNAVLGRVEQDLAKMRGLNGLTPEFASAPDFAGNRLTNIAQAVADSDAIRKDQAAMTDALIANRLVHTDGNRYLASVKKLTDWIVGLNQRIIVTDLGDGRVQIKIPNIPQLLGLILTGLTKNRLLRADNSKAIVSVADLTDWIAGSGGITVADDGDGSVTISFSGSPTFTGLTISGLTLPHVGIRNGSYEWTLSGSGTSEYYLTLSGGGDPGFAYKPDGVLENSVFIPEGTIGALTAGHWTYGSNDGLGFNTVYIRLTDSSDPDSKALNYVEYAYKRALGITVEKAVESIAPQSHVAPSAGVSSISAAAGADTIDRGTFNSSLSNLVTEINDAVSVFNSVIARLEALRLFS